MFASSLDGRDVDSASIAAVSSANLQTQRVDELPASVMSSAPPRHNRNDSHPSRLKISAVWSPVAVRATAASTGQ